MKIILTINDKYTNKKKHSLFLTQNIKYLFKILNSFKKSGNEKMLLTKYGYFSPGLYNLSIFLIIIEIEKLIKINSKK